MIDVKENKKTNRFEEYNNCYIWIGYMQIKQYDIQKDCEGWALYTKINIYVKAS
jgi:uncharacterized membrane protein